jgi:hypothetical protein
MLMNERPVAKTLTKGAIMIRWFMLRIADESIPGRPMISAWEAAYRQMESRAKLLNMNAPPNNGTTIGSFLYITFNFVKKGIKVSGNRNKMLSHINDRLQ